MAEPENMFDSVAQRLEESMEALERLRAQLDGLASAEEHQAQVSESIAGAATEMTHVARSLGAATETAQSAMAGLQSTLLAADQFLQGTELRSLKTDLAAMHAALGSGLATMRQGVKEIQDRLAGQLNKAQEERDGAQADLDRARLRIEELEEKIARIPDRQQRKFGLTS